MKQKKLSVFINIQNNRNSVQVGLIELIRIYTQSGIKVFFCCFLYAIGYKRKPPQKQGLTSGIKTKEITF